MPDISVAPKKDPITTILTRQRPSMSDVSTALLRGASGKTTFGEALNTIRSKQLSEAKLLSDVQARERQLTQADKRIANQEKQFEMSHGLAIAKQKHKGFHDIWKDVSKDMSLKDQARLWEWGENSKDAVDKGDIRGNLYRGIAELGIKRSAKPAKPVLAEKKYQSLRQQGYSHEHAEGVAYGYLKLTTNQNTGEGSITDIRTGEQTPTNIISGLGLPKKIRISLTEQNTEIEKLMGRLPQLVESIKEAGGGFMGKLADVRSKAGGQLPDEIEKWAVTEANQKQVEARRSIELFREDMRKALSKNPRMSVQEQNRILAILPSTEVLSSVPDNVAALAATQKRLESVLNDNNTALKVISGPLGGKDNPHRPTTKEAYGALPSGSYFINPKDKKLKRKP